jgi:hypothetical protein
MDTFVLQDWSTIKGGANVTVTQSEAGWLDLAPYEDVCFWMLVTEAAGSPSLLYQTSPTKDETFFAAQTAGMTGTAITLTPSLTPVVTPVLAWSATFPLARYVRWQIPMTSGGFKVNMYIAVGAVAPRL